MKTKAKTKTRKKYFFTKEDTSSGDGMLTTVWGPSLWHALHTMSFNYPVEPTSEQKNEYRDFFLNLVNVLPCKYCRDNLKKNFEKLPLTMAHMKNRDSFSRYVYRLHEVVNKMLKKKSGLSYCDVRERYEHFRARCTLDDPKFKEKKEKLNVLPETANNDSAIHLLLLLSLDERQQMQSDSGDSGSDNNSFFDFSDNGSDSDSSCSSSCGD